MAIDRAQTYALALSDDDTFDQIEAPTVCRDYVCAVCHQELAIFFIDNHWRVMVACMEHGNVTSCGRVMRSTVNIQDERAHRLYSVAIRNLPDLWGELIPPKQPHEKMIKDLGF